MAKMKYKIEIKSGQILVGELLVYWETNRKLNCVTDNYATNILYGQ